MLLFYFYNILFLKALNTRCCIIIALRIINIVLILTPTQNFWELLGKHLNTCFENQRASFGKMIKQFLIKYPIGN